MDMAPEEDGSFMIIVKRTLLLLVLLGVSVGVGLVLTALAAEGLA
jgi:hypothetical protein